MRKRDIEVKVRGRVIKTQIDELESLQEAKQEFSPSELLALVNYAYSLKQRAKIFRDSK